VSLYVLDTDILTLLRLNDPRVWQQVAAHSPTELATTVITVEEQLRGWYTRLRRAKKRDELARAYQALADPAKALSGLAILSFTESAIIRYQGLKSLKITISKADLRIAAITLENGGTLATRNLRDFQQIPNLPLENWAV
jgi:tRNA(fMet)-specific endonuclease VapC